MDKIFIDINRCKGCELCIHFCPQKILELENSLNAMGYRGVTLKDKTKCTGCGICARVCPDLAISLNREKVGA